MNCLGMLQFHNFNVQHFGGQALLDVYTIQREIGRLDNIKVGLVGDLANGRTVRSLAYLLAKYENVKLYFVAPDVVKMKVCFFYSLSMCGLFICAFAFRWDS